MRIKTPAGAGSHEITESLVCLRSAGYLSEPESLVYRPLAGFIRSSSRTGSRTRLPVHTLPESTLNTFRQILVGDKEGHSLSLEIVCSQISQTHARVPVFPAPPPTQNKRAQTSGLLLMRSDGFVISAGAKSVLLFELY